MACTATAPRAGQAFSGPVIQVIDGRTICLARGPTPNDWVLVRLDGVEAGAPRGALMAAAFARRISCVAEQPDGQATIARCTLDGTTAESAPTVTNDAKGWR